MIWAKLGASLAFQTLSYIEVTPRTTGVQSILSKLWPLNILFEISKERGFASLVVCSNASHPFQIEKTEKFFFKGILELSFVF